MIYKKELFGIFQKETIIGDYETIVCYAMYYILFFGFKIGEIEEIIKK
jgi:hypothetical protein